MKLRKNSISLAYWRYFYSRQGKPTNLCPYFWQLVLAYSVLLLTLPFWPAIISMKLLAGIFDGDTSIKEEFKKPLSFSFFGSASIGTWILFSALFYFVVFLTFNFIIVALSIAGLLNSEVTDEMGGLAVIAMLILIFILYNTVIEAWVEKLKDKYLKTKRRKEKEQKEYVAKEPKKWILWEFLKASYKKYCPKIEWE